jgi:hypothetical protein
MRDRMYCDSCKREIKIDDACVSLKKEDGTSYVFDSYVCAEIFQKLNRGSAM